MKTVNLEEILANAIGISVDYLLFKNEVQIVSPSEALEAMRESCNQAIELCAGEVEQYEKQSILDLKSQII